MVLALAGDSTTTTSGHWVLCVTARNRRHGSSATRFPGSVSIRPASSSSSSDRHDGSRRELAAPHEIVNRLWARRQANQHLRARRPGPRRLGGSSDRCAGSPPRACRGRTADRRGPSLRMVRQVVQHVGGASRSGARPGGSGRWSRGSAGSSGEPGTANSSRPASCASRAVIRLPERSAASTTTTPSASPAMMRLRRGKWRACGAVPSGASVTTAPALGDRGAAGRHARAGRACRGRRRPRRPCAPARSAPSWAAASMPRARPETTTSLRPPVRGEVLRHALAVGRGVAAADQRHRARRDSAATSPEHGHDRRRVVQQREQRRVVAVGRGTATVRRACGSAPARVPHRSRTGSARRCAPTGARKGGQRIERRRGGPDSAPAAGDRRPVRHLRCARGAETGPGALGAGSRAASPNSCLC